RPQRQPLGKPDRPTALSARKTPGKSRHDKRPRDRLGRSHQLTKTHPSRHDPPRRPDLVLQTHLPNRNRSSPKKKHRFTTSHPLPPPSAIYIFLSTPPQPKPSPRKNRTSIPSSALSKSSPMPSPNLKQLLSPLASLRLTVVLLAMAMFLILAGTFAQIDQTID